MEIVGACDGASSTGYAQNAQHVPAAVRAAAMVTTARLVVSDKLSVLNSASRISTYLYRYRHLYVEPEMRSVVPGLWGMNIEVSFSIHNLLEGTSIEGITV